MNSKQQDWIHAVEELLTESRKIPMWGKTPFIDFHKLSMQIAKAMNMPSFHVTQGTPSWVDASVLKEKEKTTSSIFISLSHLEGHIVWMMSEKERSLLCYHLLLSQGIKGALSKSFQEGFYQYLLVEALHNFDACHFFDDVHPSFKEGSIANESYCLIAINIKVKEISFTAHIAISSTLQRSLIRHYQNTLRPMTDSPLSKDLKLTMNLQVGSVTLTTKQWRSLDVGDFILLDHCSYDPIEQKGSVILLLNDTPILRGRLKKNTVKIQDFAFYYEEKQSMTDENQPFDESFSPDELSEEKIPEDTSNDEALFSEEESVNDQHMWSEEAAQKGSMEKIISSREIPLTLTVEVDRLHMTLGKLLELSPGNVLELSVRPEQGVSVMVGGKKVAHGEIVKIGDALGLKILKIAH